MTSDRDTFGRVIQCSAVAACAATALISHAGAGAQSVSAAKPSVILTSAAQRRSYLANATIWEERALPSPAEILEGPPSAGMGSRAELNPSGGVPCTWESGRGSLGGNTPKFTCRTTEGVSIRVKYFDSHAFHGNREVFAEVVAARLFWALGFDADRVYPIAVKCLNCPSDPAGGSGERTTRQVVGVTEAHYDGIPIVSKTNVDQGWAFGELAGAIDAMPNGADKARQRVHFDALSLLAVFVQHGDRKPEQQRLVCRGEVDARAGDVRPLGGGSKSNSALPALVERGAACQATVATVQDLGSTFGGSGTLRSTKADLGAWAKRRIFSASSRPDRPAACTGDVTALHNAGEGSLANPRIGEAGRAFLSGLLERLSDEHIRALFDAARIETVSADDSWTDPGTKRTYKGVDAWVAVFKHKRAQIASARCTD
jgi:hypothetical protein